MIETGIYPDLPMADYHEDGALGHSGCVTIMDACPARYLWDRENPQPPKREFDIGSAVHCLVLDRHLFAERFSILPVQFTNYRSKAAQEIRDHARMSDLTPLLHCEWLECQAMAKAVIEHPVAGEMVREGIAECSYFWPDERTGVARKCRPDYVKPVSVGDNAWTHTVVNFKTAANVAPDAMRKAAWNDHWWSSESYTREGLAARGLTVHRYYYLCVEKTPPYFLTIYELDRRMVEMGILWTRKAVDTYSDCVRRDDWPAYPVTPQLIVAPSWAEYEFESRRVGGAFALTELAP